MKNLPPLMNKQGSALNFNPYIASLASAIIAVCIYQNLSFREIYDIAWLTYVIENMFHGKIIYRDLIETNPPLIVMLYSPLVWVAERLKVPDFQVIKAATIILCSASAYVSALIVSKSDNYRNKTSLLFILFLAALLLAPHPFTDFSQREHLLAAFILPYISMLMPSVPNVFTKRQKIAAGAFASIGFCLKPNFLLIYLTAIITRNKLRGKNLLHLEVQDFFVVIGGAVYLTCIIIFYPEFFVAFKLIAQTYFSYYAAPAYFFLRFRLPVYAFIIIIWISNPLKSRTEKADLCFYTAILSAAIIQMLIQFKPWSYLTTPCIIFSVILLGFNSLANNLSGLRKLGHTLIFAFMFFCMPFSLDRYYKKLYSAYDMVINDLTKLKDKGAKNIFIAGEEMGNHFILVEGANLNWTSRHQSMWMMNGIYGKPENNISFIPLTGKEPLAAQLYYEMIEDFKKSPPDIILFDTTPPGKFPHTTYNFLNWMQNNKELGVNLESFELYKTIDFCGKENNITCQYEVYVRSSLLKN